MCKTQKIALSILAGCLACLAGLGQTSPSGAAKIAGTVQDESGQALANASVAMSAPASPSLHRTATTDKSGSYTIDGVASGHYSLVASEQGFRTTPAVAIDVGTSNTTVNFTLKPLLKGEAAQTFSADSGGQTHRHPPSFRTSGVQGTTAPSGYSVGVTAEENAQVMGSVHGLADRPQLAEAVEGPIPNCGEVRELQKSSGTGQSAVIDGQLGAFYLSQEELIRAISYLETAAKADPGSRANLHNLTIAYSSAGRFSDAIRILKQLAQQRPDEGVMLLLAEAYRGSGDLPKAAEEYRKAARGGADEAVQFASGIGLIESGSTGEAAAIFSAATATHPSAARLWVGLGVAQSLQQQDAAAIRSLLHAVELDPTYLPAYSILANLSGHLDETDEQIRERLETLVASNPESPDAHYDYALALWKQLHRGHGAQSNEEIETQLKLALIKTPNFAEAHLLLGTVYADSADLNQAVPELETAVRLEPENAKAHYRLAQAYRRSGRTEMANGEMTKFQALNGNADESETISTDFRQLTTRRSELVRPSLPCEVNER